MIPCGGVHHYFGAPNIALLEDEDEVNENNDNVEIDSVQGGLTGYPSSVTTKLIALPRYSRQAAIKAHKAIRRILQKTGLRLPHKYLGSAPPTTAGFPGGGLPSLEHVSMIGLALLSASLVQNVASVNGASLVKTEKVNTDTNSFLSWKNVEKYQAELKKQAEQAEKSKKIGIIGLICSIVSFVVNAATAVWSIVKGVGMLVGSLGAASPMAIASIASGVCFAAAAGCALANCVVYAEELSGAISAKKCNAITAKISIAEGVLMGVGVLVGIIGGCLAAQAAKGAVEAVGKEAGNVAEKVTAEAVPNASKEGIELATQKSMKAAANDIAELVAQGAGQQAAEQLGITGVSDVLRQASEGALSALKQFFTKGLSRLSELFSEEGLSKIISDGIEKAAQKGFRNAAEGTAEEFAKIVAKQVSKEVEKSITAALMSTCSVGVTMGLETVNECSQNVAQGVLKVEKAEVQKEMQQIQVELDYNNDCIEWFKNTQKTLQKTISNLFQAEAQAMKGASQIMNQTAALQGRIAQAMA